MESEIEHNAKQLIRQHGEQAFTFAVEQANETRATGDRRGSRNWAAIAWAINDMISSPATN